MSAATAGSPAPITTTSLDGYVTTFNGQRHVNYLSSTRQVIELSLSRGLHPDTDRHLLAVKQSQHFGGIPAINGSSSALIGYQTSFNGQQHVNFISLGDNRVRELFFADNSWQPRDLTGVPANPQAAAAALTSRLTGYETFTSIVPPQGPPIITIAASRSLRRRERPRPRADRGPDEALRRPSRS